jgi:hypothetical protein
MSESVIPSERSESRDLHLYLQDVEMRNGLGTLLLPEAVPHSPIPASPHPLSS